MVPGVHLKSSDFARRILRNQNHLVMCHTVVVGIKVGGVVFMVEIRSGFE